MAKDDLTIINNSSLRGVLAPADVLSNAVLEDMVDFIELSSEASAQESDDRIREADKDKSWEPLEDIRKEAEDTK